MTNEIRCDWCGAPAAFSLDLFTIWGDNLEFFGLDEIAYDEICGACRGNLRRAIREAIAGFGRLRDKP